LDVMTRSISHDPTVGGEVSQPPSLGVIPDTEAAEAKVGGRRSTIGFLVIQLYRCIGQIATLKISINISLGKLV